MASLSTTTGWIAVALLATAPTIPLAHRLFAGRRAAPDSRPIRAHVVLGLTTTAAALTHALSAVAALGSPAAVGGGMTALGPGSIAFFLLFAHVGVGLQLRAPKLRDRVKKRTLHVSIAASIVALVIGHVVALRSVG